LFSKKERFSKVYDHDDARPGKRFRVFVADLMRVTAGIAIIIGVAQTVIYAAKGISGDLGLPLALVGIIIIGLGNSIPELYFAVASARRSETQMILGDLMGAIIIPATLVLGVVALIRPIVSADFSMFAVARYFLAAAAAIFYFFVRTDQKVTKREALMLLLIYIAFLITEIFTA